MPRISDKRERLVDAAKVLIHQQGYKQTTLADIAKFSDVPLGNVYYYFKTKDDLAAAVIDEHIEAQRAVLGRLEREPSPRRRLLDFIDMLENNQTAIADHGCPVGSLCQELGKEHTSLSERADVLLKIQRDWLSRQFELIDQDNAIDLACELLARLQGISLLANALHDCELFTRQMHRVKGWLQAL